MMSLIPVAAQGINKWWLTLLLAAVKRVLLNGSMRNAPVDLVRPVELGVAPSSLSNFLPPFTISLTHGIVFIRCLIQAFPSEPSCFAQSIILPRRSPRDSVGLTSCKSGPGYIGPNGGEFFPCPRGGPLLYMDKDVQHIIHYIAVCMFV
jgi:hypothetical protein